MTGPLRDDELDDEARFWAWFFESLQPARNAVLRAREAVYGSFLGGTLETVRQLSDDVSDGVHAVARRAAELTYSGIQRSPGAVVALLLLLTALIGRDAMDFEHQINGDVEIYLPDGANSTDLLNEVREQWATDIVILYVQTLSLIHI